MVTTSGTPTPARRSPSRRQRPRPSHFQGCEPLSDSYRWGEPLVESKVAATGGFRHSDVSSGSARGACYGTGVVDGGCTGRGVADQGGVEGRGELGRRGEGRGGPAGGVAAGPVYPD